MLCNNKHLLSYLKGLEIGWDSLLQVAVLWRTWDSQAEGATTTWRHFLFMTVDKSSQSNEGIHTIPLRPGLTCCILSFLPTHFWPKQITQSSPTSVGKERKLIPTTRIRGEGTNIS